MIASAAALVAQLVKYKSCIKKYASQPKKNKKSTTRKQNGFDY